MEQILQGLGSALSPVNLLWAMIGALVGTVVGILPGLGPAATCALLLPLTFNVSPTASLMLLAGIYYGAQYGGSTTSILLNIPGESASVVTCLDGYPMAKKGKAGLALAASAIGSFLAGMIGLTFFVLAAVPLAEAGLAFGPPEQFMLMLMALIVAGTFGESLSKGLITAGIGLLLAFVGADPISGINRFTFGNAYLLDGFDFVPVAVGLFAITEIFCYLRRHADDACVERIPPLSLRELLPKASALLRSGAAMVRGSLVGFAVGLLPGMGTVPASFISYSLEKRISKHPEEFGQGAVEGVAAPESANNGAVIAALLPMFALGLPCSATTAVLLAGLMMWGLQPGPLLMSQHPEVVWPVIGSLFLANVALLIINLPGSVVLAQISRVPLRWSMPVILVLSLSGAYASTGNIFGPVAAIVFGLIGYMLRRTGYPAAPLLLGVLLGDMMEQNLRRSLQLSLGDPSIFVTRPICISLIVLTVALYAVGNYLYRHTKGQEARREPEPIPSAGGSSAAAS